MKQPWQYNPSLTQERLVALAELIQGARNNVVQLHDYELGDTERATGLRAYECCRVQILRAASDNDNWPWLGILKSDGRFTFSVDSVPVRLYKGTPSSPTERRLIPCVEAMSQMNFLFEDVGDAASIIWLFAIEVTEDRYVDKITFTGYSNDVQVSSYEIPLNAQVPILADIDIDLPEPVKLGKPALGVKIKKKGQSNGG